MSFPKAGSALAAGVAGLAILGGLGVVAAQDSDTRPNSTHTVKGEFPIATGPRPARACQFVDYSEARPAWRLTARDFRMRTHLQSALTAQFGRITKVDPGPRLAHGLIGLAIDAGKRSFVVVVDPDLVNVPELDRALKAAAKAAPPEAKGGEVSSVRAHSGCHSAAELREAYDVLREVEDRRPPVLSASFRLAPEASVYRVFAQPGNAAVTELRDRLGDRVIVTEARFGTDTGASDLG